MPTSSVKKPKASYMPDLIVHWIIPIIIYLMILASFVMLLAQQWSAMYDIDGWKDRSIVAGNIENMTTAVNKLGDNMRIRKMYWGNVIPLIGGPATDMEKNYNDVRSAAYKLKISNESKSLEIQNIAMINARQMLQALNLWTFWWILLHEAWLYFTLGLCVVSIVYAFAKELTVRSRT